MEHRQPPSATSHPQALILGLTFCLCLCLLVGCIEQQEEPVSGVVRFAGTGLSLTIPEQWTRTRLAGANHPILSTTAHYGIRPNLTLESSSTEADAEQDYLRAKIRLYPDYAVQSERDFPLPSPALTAVKWQARRTNDAGLPLVHLSYIIHHGEKTHILSATCAEPSLTRYQPIFDQIIRSISLEQ